MRFFSFGKKIKKPTTGRGNNLGATEHFEWYADSGVESIQGSDWIVDRGIPYLEKSYLEYRDKVLQIGDLHRLPVRVIVRSSLQCKGGIAGATGSGELSYCAGSWDDNQFCYGIITHELCNLFTGECVTPGWPTAWWANHRSPFPTMIANEVMRQLVPRFYRMWGDYNDPLVLMFERMYNSHPEMFPRMFHKMQELNVSLAGISDPALSQIVYYFMFYGAQREIGRLFVSPPMPQIDLRAFQSLESKYHLGIMALQSE